MKTTGTITAKELAANAITRVAAKKKGGRPRDLNKQVEERINGIDASINLLTKLITSGPEKLDQPGVDKAFAYLQRKVLSAREMAKAAFMAPNLKGGFSMKAEFDVGPVDFVRAAAEPIFGDTGIRMSGEPIRTLPFPPELLTHVGPDDSIPATLPNPIVTNGKTPRPGIVIGSDGKVEGRLAGGASAPAVIITAPPPPRPAPVPVVAGDVEFIDLDEEN